MFSDRFDAAARLVPLLRSYERKSGAMVLAIPRGGLHVGSVLSRQLHIPLDVIVTKKIGAPGHEEFAVGAVGSGGVVVLDEDNVRYAGASADYIERRVEELRGAIAAKERRYRGKRLPLDLRGKTAIITDDGAATGSTVIAAVKVARALGAQDVVVALPVAPPETASRLEEVANTAVFVATPRDFSAVGQFYGHFPQVSDEEAVGYLREAGGG